LNALFGVGILSSISILFSYMSTRARSVYGEGRIENFEDWVVDHFGRRLFETFFKTYTEKVWGIPCTQIGADWAAQRIKGLSLGEAVRNALFGQKKHGVVKTLINEFRYPRLGPGQLWEACAKRVQAEGWTIEFGTKVVGANHSNGQITSLVTRDESGRTQTHPTDHVFSSMPLRTLLKGLNPPPPPDVLH